MYHANYTRKAIPEIIHNVNCSKRTRCRTDRDTQWCDPRLRYSTAWGFSGYRFPKTALSLTLKYPDQTKRLVLGLYPEGYTWFSRASRGLLNRPHLWFESGRREMCR